VASAAGRQIIGGGGVDRADHSKSTAWAPTNCWRWRRGAAGVTK